MAGLLTGIAFAFVLVAFPLVAGVVMVGGHADAAAVAGDKGGEASGEGDIHEGITVYSMTESGLALQATVTGTKYWKDKKLN